MRKTLILFAAIVFSAVLHAQNEVTTFMGIPVDGTKEEVIGKLQEKGFVLSRSGDVLKGEYNGNEVSIEIQTHQDKVWRLAVSDAASLDGSFIKRRFNDIVRQFESDPDYIPHKTQQTISENEDILNGVALYSEIYDAAFFQKGSDQRTAIYRLVWLTVDGKSGPYKITIYFENGYNDPDYEDLQQQQ